VPISNAARSLERRFRPGVWPTLAAIVLIAAMVSLGNWQARRADVRGTAQAQADAMAAATPLELRSASAIDSASRYRRVRAEGEYVARAQVWLDNRTHNGVAGYQVLTPLRLDDGTYALVARGWIAKATAREAPPAPPPPGHVTVEGRLDLPPSSFLELKHAVPAGNVWQNLDLAEYAKVTGLEVAPLVIEEASGASDGLVRDWPAPDLGRDKNIGYMWQWYAFATVTFVFWCILSWRRRDER
jgi:surfeit locus 1 family protein